MKKITIMATININRIKNDLRDASWLFIFIIAFFGSVVIAIGQCRTSVTATNQDWSTSIWTGCSSSPAIEGSSVRGSFSISDLTGGKTLSVDISINLDGATTITGGGTASNYAIFVVKAGKTLAIDGSFTIPDYVKIVVESGAQIIVSNTFYGGANTIFEGEGTIQAASYDLSGGGACGATCPTMISLNTAANKCKSSAAMCAYYCSVFSAGTLASNATICFGSTSGQLSLSSYSGTIVRWESISGSASSWSNIAHTSDRYTSGALTGTTRFRVLLRSSSGSCTKYSNEVTITVNRVPSSLSGTVSRCSGAGTDFYSTGTNVISGATYTWSVTGTGNTIWGSGTSATVTWSSSFSGTAQVRVVTVSSCGNSTVTRDVTINPRPVVTINTPSFSICNGASITPSYTSSVSNSVISWTNNNSLVTISNNNGTWRINNTSNTTQIATITVTATANGCQGSNTFTITVGAINSWNGSYSTEWHDERNWCGGIPTASHSVVIPNTLNKPIINSVSEVATCKNLLVDVSSSLTIETGSLAVVESTKIIGSIIFNGTGTASFGGTFTLDKDGFWVDNTSTTITFNGNVSFEKSIVSNSLLSINGNSALVFPASGTITMTGSAVLKLGQNVSIIGADADSYVIGKIEKTVSSTNRFIFPIGKGGTYRPIGIQPYSNTLTTFQAEYFIGSANSVSPDPSSGMESVSSIEYWDLHRVSGDSVRVTLFWGAESNVIDPYSLKVAHFNGTAWEGIDVASYDGISSSITTLKYQDNFSPFTLGSSGVVQLPVELKYFTLNKVPSGIELAWATRFEENNSGFEVQRSEDGFKTFEVLGFVEGQGFSSVSQEYSFLDSKTVGKPGAYYRLKQIDFNGAFKFSEIKYIGGSDLVVSTKLYPNPTEGKVIIALGDTEIAEELAYTIIGSDGLTKSSKKVEKSEISESLTQSISGLKNGVYTLILKNGSIRHSIKLIKI